MGNGVYLDLASIVRDGSIYDVRVGQNLNDVGAKISPPRYWDFGQSDGSLLSSMGFGALELQIRTYNNVAKVCSATIKLYFLKTRKVFLFEGRDGKVSLRLPQKRNLLTLSYIMKYFDHAGLKYQDVNSKYASLDIAKTLGVGNGIELLFGDEGELTLVEILFREQDKDVLL